MSKFKFKIICFTTFVILCTLLTSTYLFAASARLTWDRNRQNNISGYEIHMGTKSGRYSEILTVSDAGSGTVQSYMIDNLEEGTRYYFALKAFDTSSVRSAFSEEVSIIVAQTGASSSMPQNGGTVLLYDDFSTDTSEDYSVFDMWTENGAGELLYSGSQKKLHVLTGDNIALKLSRNLPFLSSGKFSLDFHPQVKYPAGGVIAIRLVQDEDNYYQMANTDGYGAGSISKVINGRRVEKMYFNSEYAQDTAYHISVSFSPKKLIVQAFGNDVILDANSDDIIVSGLEIMVNQQDCYIDNIRYEAD
ncbi:MAG TPA: fibronectin type III domain-containing protein [Thermodesulfobacteriaceae bacterium]|nr:fibronectin type III domain-containing protein [Thermodesulfobacteriaceae bacterium]